VKFNSTIGKPKGGRGVAKLQSSCPKSEIKEKHGYCRQDVIRDFTWYALQLQSL